MRASSLAAFGLVAGGIALAFVGWRMRDADVRTARLHQVEVAQSDANGAAEDVAAFLRTPSHSALRTIGRDRSPPEEVAGMFTQDVGMSDGDRLLFEEAEFRQRARDDDVGSLAIYRRLEEEARGSATGVDLARLCALRIGVAAARAGREEEARRELGFAASARWDLWDPAGAHVRTEALYALARLDLARGSSSAVDAFVASLWFAVNGGEAFLLPADLVVALAEEARGRAIPAPTAAALDDAARHARRVLGWRDRLAASTVAVADGEIGIRVMPSLFVLAPVAALDDLTNVGRGRASRLHVVPAGEGVGLARARIRVPLAGLDVVATMDEPPAAGAVSTVALVGALLVYALGASFAWGAIRRSQRTAAMQADFVASVSHDMKTPIAAVQAMAEMLADGRVPSAEREREYAQRIEAEMRRLGTTVRNVLDAAKIERGMDGIVRPRPTEPGAVVTHLVEAVRPSLESRGFRVRLEVAPAPLPIPVDPDALTSVVANLVDNAAKFSRETKEIAVTAAPGTSGGYVVEVLDRGPGVPAADREHVFERFWRGPSAKEDAVPGVGLGLHVARSLVVAHGGRLRVTDREGGGARFVVTWPAAPANGSTP